MDNILDDSTLRLVIVLVALLATAFRTARIGRASTEGVLARMTGGGWYEQGVLDSAWPNKPAIVRPVEGGANRKLFWVPANIFAVLTLLAALWASWPAPGARYVAFVAIGFYAVINAVTVCFFAPAVLQVEKNGVADNDPTSIRWVRLSRWRTPLSLGVNASLIIAAISLVRVP
jgi:hypothetical protein